METLKKNLLAVKQAQPDLYQALVGTEGAPYELVEFGGGPVPIRDGRYWADPYDPVTQGKRFAERILSDGKGFKNVLVLGFGFGYHIEPLLSLDANITVIELDPLVIKTVLMFRDLTGFFEKVQIVTDRDPSEIISKDCVRKNFEEGAYVCAFRPAVQFCIDDYAIFTQGGKIKSKLSTDAQKMLAETLGSGKKWYQMVSSLKENQEHSRDQTLLMILDEVAKKAGYRADPAH